MKGEDKKALEEDEEEESERQYSLYASEGSDVDKKHVEESFGNNFYD